jgi:transketolase
MPEISNVVPAATSIAATLPTRMANAIRALAMDAVQAANSGHPGAPMGMADIAVALWDRHLRHNPANPHWLNRDRFVLSNGTARCCSTRCCTSPATTCPSRS